MNRTTSHRWEKSPPNQTLANLQETLLSAFERSEETYDSNHGLGDKSRAGKCTVNAVTERFFRSLKTEKLNGYRFKTREQALLCVAEYIEDFYNSRRVHSALGNHSPMQFEMDYLRARLE